MGRDFPYTTALSVTVAIACSLLILNVLVLTTVYYRHKANRRGLVVAKSSHDASSESGNDVQLHSAGDTCKTIFAPGHYGTLRPSITMRSNLATAFEEDSQHDWPPDYISSVQTIDDMPGVTSNKTSPEVTQGIVTKAPQQQPTENILTVATLKQPVASYTSPNDGQLVPSYSPSDGPLVPSYSMNDGQLIPSFLPSGDTEVQIRE
ncbi:uncharacterized protein [Macrobrachium rosenbergii]|uniref:uncharacterized protein n=1 Tax=Macrobrachium rosenbergii TaxID=79674 RepID=UPI0034D63361